MDVITIGDAMITFDPVVTGPLRYVDTFKRKVGGAEFNVALGCSRLGLQTGWISRLGNDEFGRYIYNYARGEGIDVSHVLLVDKYPTSVYFKEVMADGSGRSFYYRSKSPTLTLKKETLDEAPFKKSKILHISGVFPAISEQNIKTIDQAIKYALKHKVKIALDPNIRLKLWNKEAARETMLSWMSSIDYLLTGIDEAELLFGTRDKAQLIEKMKEYEISHLFLKQGAEGSSAWSNGHYVQYPAVKASKVADTVGAGDGFDAGVIYGLMQNWKLEYILKFANTIGAMVVSVYGDNDGLPYLEDVLMEMGEKEFIER